MFSNMVVFSQYAMQVIMSFMMLVMIFIMLPRASVSAKRINKVLDTDPNIKDGNETEGKPDVTGEVIFNHVNFKYPDAVDYVLEDISFTAKKGETVAFIGTIMDADQIIVLDEGKIVGKGTHKELAENKHTAA